MMFGSKHSLYTSTVAMVATFLTIPRMSYGKMFYTKNDLPNNAWTLGGDGSGFMPAADAETLAHMQDFRSRNLREQQQKRSMSSSSSDDETWSTSKSKSNSHEYSDYFVDGSETFWSEGAQAWRLLGFYIDCYEAEQGYNERRSLNQDNNNGGSSACVRYLLWAAYIDVNYEGGGIGEYMFWNEEYQTWDTTACDEMANYNGNNNQRCVKMDCHVHGSENFRLLGFFKEPNFAQFYEQLFKHQGICLWDEDTYDFMQTMREVWPQGCTYSGVKDGRGNKLYFDIKPAASADVTVGLYTDSRCSEDYDGSENVADVMAEYTGYYQGNNNGGDLTLGDLIYYMDFWNSAMGIFKQCQPCKSYDLSAEYEEPEGYEECEEVEKNDDYYKNMYGHYWYYYQRYGEPDDDYYKNRYQEMYGCEQNQAEEGDYSNDDSKGHFTCYDDAGYKNVNQCMKFATHTKMMAATFRDVLTGANQATILPVSVGQILVRPGANIIIDSAWRAFDFLAVGFSSLFFIGSAFVLCQSWRRAKAMNANRPMKTPLVRATSGGDLY